jgi:Uma2 family endonuclease
LQGVRVFINESFSIPADVVDLDSFCRWACSDQFPQHGRFSFLRGQVWVDLSMEEFYNHNQVKEEIGRVLGGLIRSANLGRYAPDRMLLRNDAVPLATEPDGLFVSYGALQSGRVRRLEGASPGVFQLEGSPEMVLEVVSTTSVQKDTVVLRDLYWRAGVREYWLVDARGDSLHFNILRHGARGYTATRRQAGGWLRSNEFGRSFRLTRQVDPLGNPLYTLETQA